MDFFSYIYQYYTEKLREYEALELAALSRKELLMVLAEASSLKKFMYDNKEEGYEDTFNAFCSGLDAVGRLEQFIARGLAESQGSEAQLFFLYPFRVQDSFNLEDCPFRIRELGDFLADLEMLNPGDLDQKTLHQYAGPKWLEKTRVVISEMANYTRWIRGMSGTSCICLLRDALLPFLGLRQLGADAVPLLLSRKFFAPWGNVFYRDITPPIYDIISAAPRTTYAQLREQYAQRLLSCSGQPLQEAMTAAREYLKSVADPEKNYTVIESGVQGSMPLFVGAIASNISGFLMYTTAPWLTHQYKDIIFRNNYNYLREMETLVCQNFLFDFHSFAEGKVYIKEYLDPAIRAKAYYELLLFQEQIAQ